MLALTMGDPAGIGAEIAAGAWRALRSSGPEFCLIADPDWIAPYVPIHVVEAPEDGDFFGSALPVMRETLAQRVVPGQPDPANAPATIASIERAVRLAQSGTVRGVVTTPISKAVLKAAGFPFPGHTEFLAALTGVSGQEIMMLASSMLRVVPVTVHVSLREALDLLTTDRVIATARTAAAALLSDFGILHPRLAIAGLNPHAGEAGYMGREEITLIAPAIEALRAEGFVITGPLPPDTMFTETARKTYDAAICMYHDQALIPLKTLDMTGGVNVTLGLPIVRTSPDHGTAFDIAGKNMADASSLIAAIRLADRIARNRAASP